MLKTNLKNLMVFLTSLAAFASVSSSAISEEIVARMSGHWSPTHQSAIHAQLFADEVTKRSNGRLTIEFYPSKQLFGIREVMGAITSGAVELGGVVGVVSFPSINKNFNVASYPGYLTLMTSKEDFFLNLKWDSRFGMILHQRQTPS
jgi:TRAP-type C4-dicarboxylate transport system substrate-binding protein